MEYLALYVCEFACTAAPAFVVCLVNGRLICGRPNACAPSALLAAFFSVYLFVLLHFTGSGTLHDALRFGLDLNPHQMSLIPFANFTEDVEGHLLNVLLFIPLGLLVPMLSGRSLETLPVAATAIAVSLTIEVSQLLNSRVVDVDDLLMNVAGALIGYGVFKMMERKRSAQCDKTPGMFPMATMIVAAFLGRFFLYDEMGLPKRCLASSTREPPIMMMDGSRYRLGG